MPSQEHLDLMSELRSTRSVRASVLTLANSIHQRLKLALEANSGHGDFAALQALRDDLSPAHRDGVATSITHGTYAHEDRDPDIDPTAPTPASNPASLGGNVYGSKGPEDTDTQRSGGPDAKPRDLSPAEIEARSRASEAQRQREEDEERAARELHERAAKEAREREEREAMANHQQTNVGRNYEEQVPNQHGSQANMMHTGSGEHPQQDRGPGERAEA